MRLRSLWPILLLLPLSGCFGGTPAVADLGLMGLSAITRGDPDPVAAQSCDELLETLNERAAREATVALWQSVEGVGRYWGGPVMLEDDMMAVADGAEAAPSAGGARSTKDAEVTGTNNQESGVDEADILKTDGEWTYVLQGGWLIILHSDTVGNISEYSRVSIGDFWGGQMLLEPRDADDPDDDRLIVIRSGGAPGVEPTSGSDARLIPERYNWGMTGISVYDLSDRRAPRIIDETWIEGDNVGARLVDGHAYVVVHDWGNDLQLRTWAWPDDDDLKRLGMTWRDLERIDEDELRAIRETVALRAMRENGAILDNATLADHLPQVFSTAAPATPLATSYARPFNEVACQHVLATPDGTGRSVSTILSLGVGGDSVAVPSRTMQVLGGHPIVYGAQDAIVLASGSTETWWYWAQPDLVEATDLHWFDLDGLEVTHRASGRILGIVQDQFGIDVHDGELRVATTTGTWGRWWMDRPDPMANHVAVLTEVGGVLVEQGRVGDIAPGERIWSARFTDDRAYIVTFEQIDPLWIIDLTDPTDPTILGELEIPGVSTYIHPLSDELLLTIGLGPRINHLGEPEGLDWGRIQVSLFDISDESAPRRADVLDLSPGGNGWSWSGAVHEHKAFTYWDALDMLAVPVSTNYEYRTAGPRGDEWHYRSHMGVKLIDVDQDAMQLSIYGEVDQDLLSSADRWGGDVQRTYFLGFPDQFPQQPVSVYAMSHLGMTAHDLLTLDLQSAVAFDLDRY